MKPFQNGGKWLLAQLMIQYLEFVYHTSKVIYSGRREALQNGVVALFWHGESYCLYPALKGSDLFVITTEDKRGDYISDLCNHFGCQTLRFPDVSDGKNHLMILKQITEKYGRSNFAISLDGPLGPYHVPKDFPLVSALLTGNALLPISVNVKRKILLKKRWDQFVFPFPFNQMTVCFHEPIMISRKDIKDHFAVVKERITSEMAFNEN